jgi:hypothetical protein
VEGLPPVIAQMYKGQKISLAERKALSEVVESNADSKLDD